MVSTMFDCGSAPSRYCADVGRQTRGGFADETLEIEEVEGRDPDHQGDFGNQRVGDDRPQASATGFLFAELIDDQEIDAFEHRTFDPGIDACEGVGIKATASRFVAAVERNLYLVAAQQVFQVHIASTAAIAVRVRLNNAAQPVSGSGKSARASRYESVGKKTIVVNHYAQPAEASSCVLRRVGRSVHVAPLHHCPSHQPLLDGGSAALPSPAKRKPLAVDRGPIVHPMVYAAYSAAGCPQNRTIYTAKVKPT
jgi:hypothetical protein